MCQASSLSNFCIKDIRRDTRVNEDKQANCDPTATVSVGALGGGECSDWKSIRVWAVKAERQRDVMGHVCSSSASPVFPSPLIKTGLTIKSHFKNIKVVTQKETTAASFRSEQTPETGPDAES